MDKSKLVYEDERLDDLQYQGLFIIQKPDGYCFTSDAVALANFAKCKKGGVIVDLCSGSGVIGLLALKKTNGALCHFVEIQEKYADMCSRSIMYNQLSNQFIIHNRPLQGVASDIGLESVDTVVCNPPYKMTNSAILNNQDEIAICRHEITVTLEDVIAESSKLLKYGGKFYTVNKAERLTDIIVLLRKYALEPKVLEILPSTSGASTVMIEAKKGGKSGIVINIASK